jgi:hypothetical protein
MVQGRMQRRFHHRRFNDIGIMTWPETPEGDLHDPRHERYQEIEREILQATFAIARDAIAEAFFMTATVILARERTCS